MNVTSRGEMVANIIQAAMMHNAAATFASFVYTAKGSGEVARHTLILNADTETLYKKDVEMLNDILPGLVGIEKRACEAILASRETSLRDGIGNNPAWVHGKGNRLNGTYVYPIGLVNVYVHKDTGEVYVNGLTSGKVVIVPGTYKTVNSAPLTIAKRQIENKLPSGRFRQFALPNVSRARLRGDTLVLLMDGENDG